MERDLLHLLRAILVAILLERGLCQSVPENPCPDVFTYTRENGVINGRVSVPNDGSKSFNLAINISMVGLYQNMKLKLEFLTPADQVLSSSFLQYRVIFPVQHIVPRITRITFNGKLYCYGPSETLTENGVTNLWTNLFYKIQYTYHQQTGQNPFFSNQQQQSINAIFNADNNPNAQPTATAPPVAPATTPPPRLPEKLPPAPTPPPNPIKDNCGIANDVQTLVLKGERTVENEYPWLVGMFHRRPMTYEFQCTANLISNRHVITAAHCVWFYKAPLIDKEDIILVIGRHNISHWAATKALVRTALEITPHPSYKQDSGHCDIAIITMNEEITFRPSARPICLWNGNKNLKDVTGSKGVVAGWGRTEDGNVVAIPRKVSMPIVSQETCLRSHSDFQKLTSEMTFCAGNRDGSGPCNGDSGAGFILKKNGRWYLRGLVSTAVKAQDYSCDLNEYIVFSDVAKMGEWIQSVTG